MSTVQCSSGIGGEAKLHDAFLFQEGDIVLEINGADTESFTHTDALNLLRKSHLVTLKLQRSKKHSILLTHKKLSLCHSIIVDNPEHRKYVHVNTVLARVSRSPRVSHSHVVGSFLLFINSRWTSYYFDSLKAYKQVPTRQKGITH